MKHSPKMQHTRYYLIIYGIISVLLLLVLSIISLLIYIYITMSTNELLEMVYTDKGPVKGEIRMTVRKLVKFTAFRGIRYGKAPVGYLRFKPPEEAEPWKEVFSATSEATPCPQKDSINLHYVGDEDCLNLNVYTPKINFAINDDSNKTLLPVMVWIHGGAFTNGWTNISFYGPDFFIENDVVVVTINYRLGALGLLSLNHPNATGNAGLKDQLLALKWTQRNIEAFGGDPNRVTIFGNSAGSASIDYHVISDASKGLFHQSIGMSGSHLCKWAFSTVSEAESQAQQLGRELGIFNVEKKEELLEVLYGVSPRILVEATINITVLEPPFKPTIENITIAGDTAFITGCSADKYKSGNFSKLPHITGFMNDEALFFATKNDRTTIKNMLNSQVEAEQESSKTSSSFNFKNFFSPFAVRSAKMIIKGATNVGMLTGIDMKQRLLKEHSPAPLYYYRISFAPNVSLHKDIHDIKMNGAAHADDLAYLWHISILDYPKDPQSSFSIMQDRITRMWSNFAKFGNPTPHGENDTLLNITWPVSGSSNHYLDMNETFTVLQNPVDMSSATLSSFFYLFSKRDQCPSIY